RQPVKIRARALQARTAIAKRRSSPIERGGQAAAASQAQAPAPEETGDGRRPRSLPAAHLLLSQRLPFLPLGTSRSLPQEEAVKVRAVHQELQARARSKLRPCDRSSRRDAKPQEFPKEAQRPTQGASQGPWALFYGRERTTRCYSRALRRSLRGPLRFLGEFLRLCIATAGSIARAEL